MFKKFFFSEDLPEDDNKKILDPNALINMKLAEISMNREVRKFHIVSSAKSDVKKTTVADKDSIRKYLFENIIPLDIVKLRKAAQILIYKVLDVSQSSFVGEKLVYSSQNELQSTSQRYTFDQNDIVEIMVGDRFELINDEVTKKYFASRRTLSSN